MSRVCDDHPSQGDALSALHNGLDGKRAALGRRLDSNKIEPCSPKAPFFRSTRTFPAAISWPNDDKRPAKIDHSPANYRLPAVASMLLRARLLQMPKRLNLTLTVIAACFFA